MNQELTDVLSYNPTTGEFHWTVRRGKVKAGDRAGTLDKEGYRILRFKGKAYKAHRTAYFFVHGEWPTDEIDHLNGIKDDNRIDNLRDVSRQVNSENRLGKGIEASGTKFRAYIRVAGKLQWLGKFATAAEATARYVSAKQELHTGFARVLSPAYS